jgi:hypothetical protein
MPATKRVPITNGSACWHAPYHAPHVIFIKDIRTNQDCTIARVGFGGERAAINELNCLRSCVPVLAIALKFPKHRADRDFLKRRIAFPTIRIVLGAHRIMTLDSITSQRAASAYTDALSRATSATGATATSGAPGASGAIPPTTADAVVALSPEAQAFARALAAAQATPDVRADKVAAAQARIANRGTGIHADALATTLLGGTQ